MVLLRGKFQDVNYAEDVPNQVTFFVENKGSSVGINKNAPTKGNRTLVVKFVGDRFVFGYSHGGGEEIYSPPSPLGHIKQLVASLKVFLSWKAKYSSLLMLVPVAVAAGLIYNNNEDNERNRARSWGKT